MLSQFLLPSDLSLHTTQSVIYLNVYFASCVGTNATGSHQCLHKSVFASVPTHQHQEDLLPDPATGETVGMGAAIQFLTSFLQTAEDVDQPRWRACAALCNTGL